MKGDIAFAGFMMTSDEWQALDGEIRAELMETATHTERYLAPPVADAPLAEGSGPFEQASALAEAALAEDSIDPVPVSSLRASAEWALAFDAEA